ncbi:unnamed protein product [Parnassius mnemosyne]|uniref:DDE Tnp4 domain-containing protein n=1 Tax=Parnassius mnemosyne TaxID=213953 RepID=A0AAV1K7S8_9NEOP
MHRNRTRHSMEQQFVELIQEPSGEFENFHRMSLTDFNYLLSKVLPLISKQDTHLREAIPAKIRLAVTLRFLATGDSFKSLHYLFKISSQLISKIVVDVCKALNDVLKDEIKMPVNEQQWLEVENGFKNNFPHAVGVIDGKHIIIQCPDNSGSEYFNYKKTFSIVLLALVDCNYKLMYANIGSQGRISDGGVFKKSSLWQKISSETLNLPKPRSLSSADKANIPYVFLADGAFALHNNIMKPYPGTHNIGSPKRIFNTRLSRSRVVVENVFGILANRFRIFKKPIDINIDTVPIIIMTCLLLHNFLRKSNNSSHIYMPPGIVDTYDENGVLFQPGTWRQNVDKNCALRNIAQIPRRSTLSATQIRDHFAEYLFRNN